MEPNEDQATQEQIDNWFTSHPPFGDQSIRYELIRRAGKELVIALGIYSHNDKDCEVYENAWNAMKQTIINDCPDSIEKNYALAHLASIESPSVLKNRLKNRELLTQIVRFQVVMPANEAIACNEKMVGEIIENPTTKESNGSWHDLGWHGHHWEAEGKPDGGQSYGFGFTIAWQRGSLVEQGRNGAFLTEVLSTCLDRLAKGRDKPIPVVASAIGYTILFTEHNLGDILGACLDELEHKDKWFPCKENTLAIEELSCCLKTQGNQKIEHLTRCLELLNARVKRRETAGTYGTHIADE